MAKFGALLAELRQEQGLSQRELAERLHLAGSTISNYETGSHYPDLEKICLIAEYFDVNADYLLGRSRVRLPLTQLRQPVWEDYTAEELCRDVLALPPELRQSLVQIVRSLEAATVLSRYSGRLP